MQAHATLVSGPVTTASRDCLIRRRVEFLRFRLWIGRGRFRHRVVRVD
jgi:hypothetical protein